ncbi:lipase 3-like isoform X3 [Hermetia illucens]|uniref:lipase 3-like isoform X3 n=1 Tax=Hermetia illucens TaxID=343691 RepID=UPI0018CC2130|nr:lipase 3-like isoform X3 [Hermetia illucens]
MSSNELQSTMRNQQKFLYFLILILPSLGNQIVDSLITKILSTTTAPPQRENPTWDPLTWIKDNFLEPPYNPDIDLTTMEIATRHGYPAEAHTVTTEDGYLLTMHRIPCGRIGCHQKGGRGRGQPVFLQHGLLSSSADWVISGPGKALAYILADAGYDVWLGNARGNTYSRRHVSMSNSDSRYWDFSWHEMAVYDIPAEIDYIYDIKAEESYMNYLDDRGSSDDLLYIGHSMGTTMAFALLSSRPEYNNKIMAAFALAPVAFMSHVKSPIRFLAPFSKDIEQSKSNNQNLNIEIPLKYLTSLRIPNWVDIIANRILNNMSLRILMIIKFLGANEFMPQNRIVKFLAKYGCELTQVEREICENTLYVLCGFDKSQFNSTLMPVIFSHTPAGTSTKTLVHYAQEIDEEGNFQWFDYGLQENKRRYGQDKPPSYNITEIRTPFSLFYAQNDWLAGPKDVQKVYKHLQQSSQLFKVPYDNFNHVDFLWGIDAPKLVYSTLVKIMQNYR